MGSRIGYASGRDHPRRAGCGSSSQDIDARGSPERVPLTAVDVAARANLVNVFRCPGKTDPQWLAVPWESLPVMALTAGLDGTEKYAL